MLWAGPKACGCQWEGSCQPVTNLDVWPLSSCSGVYGGDRKAECDLLQLDFSQATGISGLILEKEGQRV